MRRWLYCCLVAGALVFPVLTSAQDAPAETPSEARAAEFVGVEGAVAEDVPGGPLLIGAYGVAWLFLFLYLYRLGRLQGAANEALTAVEKRLAS